MVNGQRNINVRAGGGGGLPERASAPPAAPPLAHRAHLHHHLLPPQDFAGIFAAWLEWSVTYLLIARDTPQGRLLTKDDARGVIDGTLFYK